MATLIGFAVYGWDAELVLLCHLVRLTAEISRSDRDEVPESG
ncbi:hypothetical protein AF72_06100 [Xylella taiwanensis]|uniref:Uncharacterized protein n=1 Tax=Xylella taiwanensis TaxID=1444770 RepID=Z9JJG4_9GAMM|nr:hypothetical protein AF72_06100 [Xylella taiwanensis]